MIKFNVQSDGAKGALNINVRWSRSPCLILPTDRACPLTVVSECQENKSTENKNYLERRHTLIVFNICGFVLYLQCYRLILSVLQSYYNR